MFLQVFTEVNGSPARRHLCTFSLHLCMTEVLTFHFCMTNPILMDRTLANEQIRAAAHTPASTPCNFPKYVGHGALKFVNCSIQVNHDRP